jgi:hypothetical protein
MGTLGPWGCSCQEVQEEKLVNIPLNSPNPERSLSRCENTSNSGSRIFLLILILGFLILPLCAGTKINHRWVLTRQTMPKFNKILIIGVLENYLIRQEFEDEMEKLLPKSGVEGVKSHMVLPPRNELPQSELKQWIKEGDCEGVLVIRPISTRKETSEVLTTTVGSSYVPPGAYYSFYPYWNMAWNQTYVTSSYLKENTIVSAEFNLYNTKDEKLVWSGETDTEYSKDFGKLGKEYARALVKQLKKDKVIGAK